MQSFNKYVAVNCLFQLVFVFPFFKFIYLAYIIISKNNEKINWNKKLTTTYT